MSDHPHVLQEDFVGAGVVCGGGAGVVFGGGGGGAWVVVCVTGGGAEDEWVVPPPVVPPPVVPAAELFDPPDFGAALPLLPLADGDGEALPDGLAPDPLPLALPPPVVVVFAVLA